LNQNLTVVVPDKRAEAAIALHEREVIFVVIARLDRAIQ
jgi:hypothetical protein